MNETYEEYMKRRLEESVQYKPEEENEIEKYMNYEVEEEKPKNETDWSEVVLGILYWGILFGMIIYVIIRKVNGG